MVTDLGELDDLIPTQTLTVTDSVQMEGVVPIPLFIELHGGIYGRYVAMAHVYPEHLDTSTFPRRRALILGNSDLTTLGLEWNCAKMRA